MSLSNLTPLNPDVRAVPHVADTPPFLDCSFPPFDFTGELAEIAVIQKIDRANTGQVRGIDKVD